MSKLDARHFFHNLKVGRKWQKYLCHPPVDKGLPSERFPVHMGVPMGFTLSASWAQGVNAVSTQRAQLPPEARLNDSHPPPSTLPLWASILDDVWALEAEPQEAADSSQLLGPRWLADVSAEWDRMGIETNHKKTITGSVRAEVPGVLVDGAAHRLGVALEKLRVLLEAGLWVVSQHSPQLRTVQGLVGKLSFAMTFRAGARSLLFHVFREMASAEASGAHRLRFRETHTSTSTSTYKAAINHVHIHVPGRGRAPKTCCANSRVGTSTRQAGRLAPGARARRCGTAGSK